MRERTKCKECKVPLDIDEEDEYDDYCMYCYNQNRIWKLREEVDSLRAVIIQLEAENERLRSIVQTLDP